MARVPMVERDELSPEDQPIFDAINGPRQGVRGPFGALLHHPQLASKVGALGEQLRFKAVLSGAERELVILAAVREVGGVYQWYYHEPLGLKDGMRPEAVEVIRHQRPNVGLTKRETLIIDTVRTLVREHRLSDEQFAAAEAEFGRQAVVEMIVLAGYYVMMGLAIAAFNVELPDGVAPPFEV